MSAKRPSGPYPLSCITCRERRKKCDRTHPTCNRCKAGGFTCLGYASRKPLLVDDGPEPTPQDRTIPGSDLSEVPDPTPLPTINPSEFSFDAYGICDASLQIQSAPHRQTLSLINSYLDIYSHVNSLDLSIDYTLPDSFCTQVDTSDDPPNDHDLESSSCSLITHQGNNPIIQSAQLDLSVYLSPDTSAVAAEYITSQYERAYSLMHMELINVQDNFVKSCVLSGITVSQSACWSLFIGAKVFEVAVSDYRSMLLGRYVKTLDRFGKQIATVDRNNMSTRELTGWMFAAAGLFELRLLIDPRRVYKTLRLAIPIFFAILEQEPTARISLHSTLVSAQLGLNRFALADVTLSFLTGLPQLVSWDADLRPELAGRGWPEWMPACPLTFVLVLCRVNIWRHRVCTSDPGEWRWCEQQVKEWRPDGRVQNPGQSWKTIGRLGVQEALRHMTLIYLYMGMCGLKSGDHKVQGSCTQIVRLCKLAQVNPNMSVSLHLPALIAGVCAISETHRSVIYSCLEQAEACRSYLFGTARFAAAVEHLWHGPGRHGAQVTWDDYLDSCRVIVRMKC